MNSMTPIKNAELQKRVGLAFAFRQGLEIPAKRPDPEASVCAADVLRNYTQSGGAGIGTIVANIAALAQAQQAAISLDDAVHDWDLMFRAVEDRISSAVGKVLVATPGLEPQAAIAMVHNILLECVTALSQLHEALTQERGRRHQLGQETADAEGAIGGGLRARRCPGQETAASSPDAGQARLAWAV